MTRRDAQLRVQGVADRVAARSAQDATRHKCFVSYHAADAEQVAAFLEESGHVFTARTVGVTEEDDFIESSDTQYVIEKIREKYLTGSTMTMVLIGRCTWARKFVDWEVYSSLRDGPRNTRNGLLAITLPSAATFSDKRLPDRVADNVDGESGYARWWKYPTSADQLKQYIHTAFDGRSRTPVNNRARKLNNSTC